MAISPAEVEMTRALAALVAGIEAVLLIIGIMPRPRVPASKSAADDTTKTTVTADRSA